MNAHEVDGEPVLTFRTNTDDVVEAGPENPLRFVIVEENDVLAQTRTGKQVLNVKDEVKALVCKPTTGDTVACVGENRKVLVFSIDELPIMGRGKGVRLQKYKDGGLSDATTFTMDEGLSWKDPAGRTRTETELAEWIGKRAGTGRMAPRGFPRDNKFN